MTEKKVTVDLRIDDKLLVVEEVPALVCDRCGEKVFTPEVTRKLQALGKQRKNPPRTLEVPLFKMDEIAP
jgi:HTH-type transcriptional regulator/antitoxin MqsA